MSVMNVTNYLCFSSKFTLPLTTLDLELFDGHLLAVEKMSFMDNTKSAFSKEVFTGEVICCNYQLLICKCAL